MEEDYFNFEGFENTDPEPGQETTQTQEEQFTDDNLVYEDGDFNEEPKESPDLISKLLEARGINPQKIQIYDEDDKLTEVPFSELSDDEKFEILSMDNSQSVMPTDDELEILNYLRKNGMSLKDFAEWQKQVGVQEYMANQQPHSEIDDYSDDEIIAYDFIQRFGDQMTDEEIDTEIERLKTDEEAYKKRVDLLRATYKSEAEAQAKLYEEQEKSQAEANMAAFRSAYIDSAKTLDDIQGISLDDNDKEELLQFVLTKDVANRTGFSKAMDDPANVLKMAWFLLHGEESFDATVDYFKKEIAKRDKTNKQPRAVSRSTAQKATDAFKF